MKKENTTIFDKIKEKLKDDKYISNLIKEESNKVKNSIILNLKIDGQPNSYARERKGRGKHFYNPKGDKMTKIRSELKESIGKKQMTELTDIFNNDDIEYNVTLEISYYLQIQKTSSVKSGVLKQLGFIKPNSRPDIDNYDKFILDTLHEIAYADDSHVTKIISEKKYALEPKTEIKVTINYII